MWYSKILVAYDGSEPADKAIELAVEMAKAEQEVSIIFAYATKLSEAPFGGIDISRVVIEESQDMKERLEKIADGIPNHTEVRILRGTSPASLLIRCCEEEQCDLIVMGSRGMGGVKGFLGSVSHSVVQESHANVLITKVDD